MVHIHPLAYFHHCYFYQLCLYHLQYHKITNKHYSFFTLIAIGFSNCFIDESLKDAHVYLLESAIVHTFMLANDSIVSVAIHCNVVLSSLNGCIYFK